MLRVGVEHTAPPEWPPSGSDDGLAASGRLQTVITTTDPVEQISGPLGQHSRNPQPKKPRVAKTLVANSVAKESKVSERDFIDANAQTIVSTSDQAR